MTDKMPEEIYAYSLGVWNEKGGIKHPEQCVAQYRKKQEVEIVWLVWCGDNDTTHVFSTAEKASEFANSVETSCAITNYAMDMPERFTGVMQ